MCTLYICMCTHTCIYIIFMYVWNVHDIIHSCVHMCTHTWQTCICHTKVHTYAYVVHTYIHMHTYIHTYMYDVCHVRIICIYWTSHCILHRYMRVQHIPSVLSFPSQGESIANAPSVPPATSWRTRVHLKILTFDNKIRCLGAPDFREISPRENDQWNLVYYDVCYMWIHVCIICHVCMYISRHV